MAAPVSLLGGGYDVILTVMRAFSRVTSIELPIDAQAETPTLDAVIGRDRD